LEIGFSAPTPATLLLFLKSVTNALCFISSVKAGSAIIEKVLLCGGDRRERTVAGLIDFIKVL